MRKLLIVGLFLLVPRFAVAGAQVGASINVLDFFLLPGAASGVSTKTNFGLGSIHVGYGVGKIISLRAVLSYDNTGTIEGSGTLFGQSYSASAKYKVLIFGGELFIDPPFFPLYFKAGAGIGKLSASANMPSPFNQLGMNAAFYGGIGISFSLKDLQFHAGLDAVYVSVDTGSTGLDVSGFPYFRTLVGATYHL